jgi:hypothetical protein
MWLLPWLVIPAAAGRAPCWVAAPCAPYTDATHVVGVGSGATPAAAEDAARAAIAKVFSVRIARAEESLVTASRGAGGALDQRTTLTVTTRSETERRLSGVVIAERWVDRAGATWALAVLDRAPATEAVRAELTATEATLAALGGSGAERVRQLERALPAAEKLAYLAEELGVLTGAAAVPSVRWDELARRRDEARSALWVAVGGKVAGGPLDPGLEQALVAAVTAQGVAVRAGPGDLAVALDVAEELGKPDASGFVAVHLRGALVLYEGPDRVAEAPVHAEAASRDVAKARALARQALAAELAAAGPLVAGVLR